VSNGYKNVLGFKWV